jgi:dynein heavy chain 1
MFEVETLKYATLATVSRCGMVWFSQDTVTLDMVYYHYLCRLQQENFDSLGEEKKSEEDLEKEMNERGAVSEEKLRHAEIRKQAVDSIREFFEGPNCFMTKVLAITKDADHIMEFTYMRVLEAMFSLVRTGVSNILKNDREERLSEA